MGKETRGFYLPRMRQERSIFPPHAFAALLAVRKRPAACYFFKAVTTQGTSNNRESFFRHWDKTQNRKGLLWCNKLWLRTRTSSCKILHTEMCSAVKNW